MKLSSFVATADLTLDLSEFVTPGEDAELHVTVDKNAITPAMTRRVQADEENLDLVVETIIATVKKWDLVGEGKKPIPLDDEHVSQIGGYFLFALFSKIIDALNDLTDEEGKVSAAAS